jgi:hypothetical protein
MKNSGNEAICQEETMQNCLADINKNDNIFPSSLKQLVNNSKNYKFDTQWKMFKLPAAPLLIYPHLSIHTTCIPS